MYTVAILTVSDSVSAGTADDRSGPALVERLSQGDASGIWKVIHQKIVPDDGETIKNIVRGWADDENINLVLTSGGTGFGVRDVTPEAVGSLIEKHASGLVIAMITASLNITPMAALSRPVAGTRGGCLMITLPGSPKGAVENLAAVLSVLPHAVELTSGGSGRQTHANMK